MFSMGLVLSLCFCGPEGTTDHLSITMCQWAITLTGLYLICVNQARLDTSHDSSPLVNKNNALAFPIGGYLRSLHVWVCATFGQCK